jgi:hypothetical protein
MLSNFSRSAVMRVALSVLLCSGASACNFNPLGSGDSNWGFGIQCPNSYAVTSISFLPADTLRIRVGAQDSVEVRAFDATGALGPLCAPTMTVSTASAAIATSAGPSDGFFRFVVRGVAAGRTVLRASSGGRSDSLPIVVSARLP